MPETPQEIRESLLGRAMLEAAGFDADVIRKAHRRLREGLDATKVKEFQYEGTVVVGSTYTDFTERREAAKEIARLADHYPNRLEHDVSGDVQFIIRGLDPDKV